MREILAGNTVALRVRFRDDLGVPFEAQNVSLSIFPPDADTTNPAEAVLTGATPIYLGEGIFEYDYLVPTDAVEGTWHDVWEGQINAHTVIAEMPFAVVAEGFFDIVPDHQLYKNNKVTIRVSSSIAAIDGTHPSSDIVVYFYTTFAPLYADIQAVELYIGAYLTGLDDETIELALLEASLTADAFTWSDDQINSPLFQHARRQLVICLAAKMLLTNAAKSGLKGKSLGDLSVWYDPNTIRDAIRAADDCIDEWKGQVIAGGGAKVSSSPRMVIKGEYDPDRLIPSRNWEDTSRISPTPAANTHRIPSGSRRALRTYKKRYW